MELVCVMHPLRTGLLLLLANPRQRTRPRVIAASHTLGPPVAAGGKLPYWSAMVDGEPFFFGGIWDWWHKGQPDGLPT